MAILKTVLTTYGFEANDSYHRVEYVELLNKTKIRFSLRSYKSIEFPFFQELFFECAYDLTGDNPIRQAYKYLKTLPEFAGAVDC
jgi:hypothetical protein